MRRSENKNLFISGLNPNAAEFVPEELVHAVQGQASKPKARYGKAVLETAPVKVTGQLGSADARIVFDTGSTLSFVRKALCTKIGAKWLGSTETSIGRFGDTDSRQTRFPLKGLNLQLRNGSILELVLRELPIISSPVRLTPWDEISLPSGIQADELAERPVTKNCFVEIDILMGLDYYYDIVGPELWRNTGGLVVKGTAVGKIVTGFLPKNSNLHEKNVQLLVAGAAEESSRLLNLERFWRLEDIGIKDQPGLKDDEAALEQFKATTRFRNGRYEVQWPFKSPRPEIATNYVGALRRLKSVCRKLKSDPDLAQAYDKIFKDQLAIGVIEKAPKIPQGMEHYLPHHAVVTPGKETTKVRVVFDASAKETASSPSLNEVMHRGPVFLNDLVGMLLRFRLPQVAVVSDVEKAFLQIALQVEHSDCTRFLWLADPSKPPLPENIVVYRQARVGFGMKASPFLLAATIIHHMLQVGTPTAIEIKENTYMDNVFGGRETTEEAKAYYSEAKNLFRQMTMNLREWYSNDRQLVESLPEADRGKCKCPTVLGLKWNTDEDSLYCSCAAKPSDEIVPTKRQILSFVASTFDPCGWFSSITVRGKVIMQDLWKAKKGWDDTVDSSVQEKWKPVQRDIAAVAAVKLPRRICPLTERESLVQLHVFCDASSQAYAAAVYLKVEKTGQIDSDLVFAKARVAPVKKPLTIPQLEVMAAVLGVRMLQFVTAELKNNVSRRYLWTDSTCVLGWLISEKVNVVFVENRLREIRNSPDVSYGHVSTSENPADIPSRGTDLETLETSKLWWKGPSWLRLPEDQWPRSPATFEPRPPPEPELLAKTETAPIEETTDSLTDLRQYSSLARLLRVTAYVIRAVERMRARHAADTRTGVTADELKKAKEFWERRVQRDCFPSLEQPKAGWKNKIRQLGIFRDEGGFLRCRGRFANSDLPADMKHPKLLPAKHPFTTLVIQNSHAAVMHTGLKGTFAHVRQSYWIPAGRSVVKDVLSRCRVCIKHFGGHFKTPTVAPLPEFRSKLARPFAVVGIDYLGPMFVRTEGTADKQKVWVALFTCAAIRAVHLELVNSLTAQDFLLSLRRFMALYGAPELIVSDNAKQFGVADRTLQRLWKEVLRDAEVQSYSANHGISWKFITEKAPWFGGFYERLVALVKGALKASLGKWTLTPSELHTLLYEVSFVLNGRPLTYSDCDPADFVLTPAHLLFRSRDMFPEVTGEIDPAAEMRTADALIAHWKAGQNVLREFWDIWKKQYLLALRESWRPKKERGVSSIPVEQGAVVLIKESLPRGMWKVGRISKARPSADGKVRTVEVTLPGGSILTRPVASLYPVEAASQSEDTVPGEPYTANEKDSEAQCSRPKRRAAAAAREGAKRCLA